MTQQSSSAANIADRELVITRFFDAPSKLMFAAWTDPAHVRHWMGPRGFTAHQVKYDFRPGGSWRLCLRPDDGSMDLWQSGVYRKILAPKLLEFTFGWDSENGQPRHETLVTLTFEEQAGKTKMTFRQAAFESIEERDGHNGGWSSAFDRLSEYLEGEILTR